MSLWNEKFKPMLLAEINKPFNSKDYLYEIKYDGIRVLVYVSPKKIRIINRNFLRTYINKHSYSIILYFI